MKDWFFLMCCSLFFMGAAALRVNPHGEQDGATRFPSSLDRVPDGWQGEVFELSQDYPEKLPSSEQYPWLRFSFESEPLAYGNAVLSYIYEGNREVDFRVQKNRIRTWYHAPWMHAGEDGREFIRGLTRERSSRPLELAATQQTRFQNWAVGIYNPPGGYTIGQVWKSKDAPSASLARFPEGTVSAKLLFTEASDEEVPFMSGAPEWTANIRAKESEAQPRTPGKLRLLQLDFAVKDKRAQAYRTGWVFGTFVYQADAPGDDPWKRLRLVGLQWGNDPGVLPGEPLKQTWLNSQVKLAHYGFGNRLNGPVDNPKSSCVACHSRAEDQFQFVFSPPRTMSEKEQAEQWFINRAPDEAFTVGQTSTDYSLQLAIGIANWRAEKR